MEAHDSATQVMERIGLGDRRALARALTCLESGLPGAGHLLRQARGLAGGALVVGITGAPGSGKSTLTDGLIRLLREGGKTVAVLAVDPSSPFSGGAVLGDRVRMQRHACDSGVFIRSMAARGQAGGLAPQTSGAASLLDAAGFDVILIETVGVGQGEVEVARIANVCVVVLAPGMGDEIQAIKAGVMEIGDVFAVNKGDLPGAAQTESDVRRAFSSGGSGCVAPRVVCTTATTGSGIGELLAAVEEVGRSLAESPSRKARARRLAMEKWLGETRQILFQDFLDATGFQQHVEELLDQVTDKPADVYTMIESHISVYKKRRPHTMIANADHIGIAVPDLAKAMSFYRDALGLEPEGVEEVPEQGVRVAMFPVGPANLEFLEPTSDGSPIAKFLEKKGPGVHHVALRVDDLRQVLAALKEKGVRLINDSPTPGAGGKLVAFVHPASTGGVLLELCQRCPPDNDNQ